MIRVFLIQCVILVLSLIYVLAMYVYIYFVYELNKHKYCLCFSFALAKFYQCKTLLARISAELGSIKDSDFLPIIDSFMLPKIDQFAAYILYIVLVRFYIYCFVLRGISIISFRFLYLHCKIQVNLFVFYGYKKVFHP